jgi:hypothetical protein
VATDLIDSLLRPRQVSIPELVTALRDIHERKSLRDSRPSTGMSLNDPMSLPSFVPNVILDLFARGAEDIIRLLKPTQSSEFTRHPDANFYSAVQGRVGKLETELRRHAESIDRLLEANAPASARSGGAAHHQQTLYLQCPRGARTAGRFRCVNRRVELSAVSSLLRPFTMNREPLVGAPALSMRPGSFVLNDGASEVVTVEIDFGCCPDLSSGTVQTSIDLRMNDALALKIWIEVELHDRC